MEAFGLLLHGFAVLLTWKTLALMMVAGELGWQINHNELRLDPATQKTSQLWSHAHMILNHFPTIGFVIGLGVYVGALILDNIVLKRAGLFLFVACAIANLGRASDP